MHMDPLHRTQEINVSNKQQLAVAEYSSWGCVASLHPMLCDLMTDKKHV